MRRVFFGILTLIPTRKIRTSIPILIYGEEFWKKTVYFEYLAELGMISVVHLLLIDMYILLKKHVMY